MKCSISDRETLERIYQGCKLARDRRRISPNTRAIYEILEARTKEALNQNRNNYDRMAAIRDIEEIQVIQNYVRKGDADIGRLEDYEHWARLVDYAMVFCKALKAVEGTSFQKMFWIDIVNQLDRELANRQEWIDLGRDDDADAPKLTLHDELKRAIKDMGESDINQGFWEIRLYAKRNGVMHSGLLDRRLRGEYDEVSKTIDSDLANLTRILPEEEVNHISRYRRILTRYRVKWFKPLSTDHHGQIIWEPSEAAQEHLVQIQKTKTAHNPPETEEEKLRKIIAALAEEIRIMKEMLSHNTALTNKTKEIVLESLHMAVEAVSKPNTPQKRVLEGHDVYTPNSKRRRIELSEEENKTHLDIFEEMSLD